MADIRRVAVITGGATGIGLGIVRHLAEGGMSVVAIDRNTEACAAAQKALAEFGERARVVAGDIGSPEGAQLGIDTALAAFGRLDLLCNNAVVHPNEEIAEHKLATWREAFRVNVDGTMLCSQAAIPPMKRQGGGVIVNIGSISGVMPYAGGGAYATTKAAIANVRAIAVCAIAAWGLALEPRASGGSPGSRRLRTSSAGISPPSALRMTGASILRNIPSPVS